MVALAHSGLLWMGAGLATVPVIIHLLFRRRHRVVKWAAMAFLLAALKKQKRRVQMENLLLLLLRCAMILLLGLALARPAVRAAALSPLGGSAQGVVLVLDTSASTAARATGRRILDRIRERARSFLQELPEGSEVTVVVSRDDLAGGAPAALLEGADPSLARDRIDQQLQTAYGPNDLAEVFRFVKKKLDSVHGRKGVVLITDLQHLQHRDWTDDKSGRVEDLHRALRELGDRGGSDPVPLTVLGAGVAQPNNVAITNLTIEQGRAAFAGTTVGLSATLANYGSTEASGTLTLYTSMEDGTGWEKRDPVHTVNVPPTLAAGEARPHSVDLFVPLAADQVGPTRFKAVFRPDQGPHDRLDLDNERYLALRVRSPIRVLPVRSFRGAMELLEDVAVLKFLTFLNPVSPEELATVDLARIDVIVWADADFHELDEPGAQHLKRFVERGGGLIAYLGDYARPASRINGYFFKEDGSGLFPMLLKDREIVRVVEGGSPVRIDLAAADRDGRGHPLFRETAVPELGGSPLITAYRAVSDYPKEAVVAEYDTEARDPAVLEHRFGLGRVIVVTTTPDERGFELDATVLPAVFFFNSVHYFAAADPARNNVISGRSVSIPLLPDARRVSIEPPPGAGGIIEEPVKEDANTFRLTNTIHPGFYAVTVRALPSGAAAIETDAVHLVAANLDAGESDLRPIRSSDILALYPSTTLRFASDVDELLPDGGARDEGELSRALLAGVIALLFGELIMAWRFGNRRRRTG
jgi:hypothetical protein